jgi:ATP-dependent DNA ligase
LCAFDLLEVNGEDIGRQPLDDRKRRLARLLRLPHDRIAIDEAFGDDCAVTYNHACALGCEGIIFEAAWLSRLTLPCTGSKS